MRLQGVIMRWGLWLMLAAGCSGDDKDDGETPTGPSADTDTDADADSDTDTDSDTDSDTDADTSDTGELDADGDGVGVSSDCDDSDPQVYPGAPELCDGLDQDCDGAPETGDALTHFPVSGDPVDLIGTGVTATQSLTGGTVVACPGTYDLGGYGLELSGAVVVRPSAGPGTATLHSAPAAGALVLTAGSDVQLEDLTLTGVGIRADGAARTTLTRITVDGSADGVQLDTQQLVVDGIEVRNTVGSGAALTITDVDDGVLTDGAIDHNPGAGVRFERTNPGFNYVDAQSFTIQSNTGSGIEVVAPDERIVVYVGLSSVDHNGGPTVDGGGLHVEGAAAIIEMGGVFFEDNTGARGGGIWMGGGFCYLEDGRLERNTASEGGGMWMGNLVAYTLCDIVCTDFGLGPDDNSPEDLLVFGTGQTLSLGIDETFSCDGAGCW